MLSIVLSSYYSCSLFPSLHYQTSPQSHSSFWFTIPSSGPTFHLCHGTETSLASHDFFVAISKDAPWFLCFSHSTARFISECFLESSPFLLTRIIFIWCAKSLPQLFLSKSLCSTIGWVWPSPPKHLLQWYLPWPRSLTNAMCFLKQVAVLNVFAVCLLLLASCDLTGEEHTPSSSWLMTVRNHVEQTRI